MAGTLAMLVALAVLVRQLAAGRRASEYFAERKQG
jgi:hypothetical protein